MENDYSPKDPFAADIAAMRAAEATPESRFEDAYKAARLRELAAEDAEVAQLRAAHEARIAATSSSRFTAAELQEFAPPNPYEADLKALRDKALKETR